MRFVPDRTGRFQNRPHYEAAELDTACETLITTFLRKLHGKVAYPIATDDLTKLIERDTQDLDLYADLSAYGPDVEGVTEFRRGSKPSVAISGALYENDRQSNRVRTTLTHEYGHVHFHAYLWETEPPRQDLLSNKPHQSKIVCKRDTIVETAQSDWMEWQAGYACGAILMPKSAVVSRCREFVESKGVYGAIAQDSSAAHEFVQQVMADFQVSELAARVRLLKLKLLTPGAPAPSLF